MSKQTLIDKLIELGDLSALSDAFELCRECEKENAAVIQSGMGSNRAEATVHDETYFAIAHEGAKKIRAATARLIREGWGEGALDIYKRTLLFDAPQFFDPFCRYIEWNRPKEKKFYEPRRKQLLPVAQALQDLADDKLDLLAISEPPGIGKTTIALFYLTWIGGRYPELPMLGGSHSNGFLRGVYNEILRIVDPNGDYLWNEVFPHSPLVNTDAKNMRIDLGYAKRFETFEFSSIGSGNAGKVRAGSLLYCDDLVDGIETAMSRDRMDKLWQQYYTDLRQRKIGNCKELHIATRWSVNDVIGRLEQQYEGDERARFIRFAALDENDESNFDYPYGLGFTTEFYHQQRDIMDEVSWKALYMNEPIEREGRLYDPAELRRFFRLPDREPDNILAICDTKEQGADYCVMPILYQYGNDYYMDSVICDNGKVEVLEERVAKALVDRKVKMCRIESNRGGTIFAQNVQKRVRELGGMTDITTKWTQSNKETRIVSNSGIVKSRVLFKDESLYEGDREYREAMRFLTSYSVMGKNKHDDVPDVLGLFVDWIMTSIVSTATVMSRNF